MKQPANPHRPDVRPGKGYRILADGEAIQAGDQVQIMKSRRPFRLAWVNVEDDLANWKNHPVGQRATCNFAAIRTQRPLVP